MKAILAPKMKLTGLRKKILQKPMIRASTQAAREMQGTTVNFRTVAPQFAAAIRLNGANPTAFIGPLDTPDGMIWLYLDQGTEVRYAVMSPDYEAGTTPGTLDTQTAEGETLFIDINNPLPGIEAREWSILIAELLGPRFRVEVNDNVKAAIAGIF